MAKASDAPKASGEPSQPTQPNTGSRRIPIKQAYLHQAIMLPKGMGTEKHLGKQGHDGISLEWGPEGLWLTHKESGIQAIIPHANVASAEVSK